MDERISSWEEHLIQKGWDVERAVDLAERFYSVGGTTIDRIIDRAEAESGGSEPMMKCSGRTRECSRPEMQGLALHVTPRYRWDDLILPPKIKEQLQDLVNYLAEQETVFHRWGANKIQARGYGIKALFQRWTWDWENHGCRGHCQYTRTGHVPCGHIKCGLSMGWRRSLEKSSIRQKVALPSFLFDEADSLFGSRGDVETSPRSVCQSRSRLSYFSVWKSLKVVLS